MLVYDALQQKGRDDGQPFEYEYAQGDQDNLPRARGAADGESLSRWISREMLFECSFNPLSPRNALLGTVNTGV